MVEAIKRGIIGVTIGLGITGFVMFAEPSGWSWQKAMLAVGLASFWGPFGTVIAMRRTIRA